ncbi:pyridoxal phosphate-dependent transferase [Aspergillus crustosus]
MSGSVFSSAPRIPADAIFALTAEYLADPSLQKVNLGQGTYRDNNGQPWVLPSGLRDKTAQLVFGEGVQLATSHLHLPAPTWSNHHLLFSSLGFPCTSFQYYNPDTKSLDIDSYLSTLRVTEKGSVFILHACAHNPMGLDPSVEQWKEIGAVIKERGDAWAVRYFVSELGLESAVCLSFAKNMGLYGERVGCLVVATPTEEIALNTQSVLESLQRSEISNHPAFGAKIAETVLSDEELRKVWFEDLKTMSGRIQEMRRVLHEGLTKYSTGNWDHLIRQSGMFGFLGLSPKVVKTLKEFHIYMADNSRVSIAGLNTGNVEYVARSIGEVLAREQN